MSSGRAPTPPNMSPAAKTMLARARRIIPPMPDSFHKGQLGRIAVIGGSEDYTGAPYFSAMASARLGCDMSHVICTRTAGQVIKTYSPNLMVHPLMEQSPPAHSNPPSPAYTVSDKAVDLADRIATTMLPRLHVLVIGPGLGRDPLMQETAARVIEAAKRKKIPVIMDADALQIIMKEPKILKGWDEVILTPNVVEFGRLWDSNPPPEDNHTGSSQVDRETEKVVRLANHLWGPTIIQKGAKDYISNGMPEGTATVDLEGGKKRSGGQGDTLTGSIATFLCWRRAYLDGLWEETEREKLSEAETLLLAAFAGAAVTRECSRLAFLKKGRSLQASDLTDEVHNAFLNLFGDDEPDSARL
ncbi:YjeF domain containing protein [Zalerion maritima]|uniref:ATP-dependent (S)-NAD(P)H-hydrate dehydratase n=1 Tax=Zalerion maritima TaxID=339359 RepID=A0AAD5RX55_9PEZI|nr:YjeF domain containing protein [Zalerion maritima]